MQNRMRRRYVSSNGNLHHDRLLQPMGSMADLAHARNVRRNREPILPAPQQRLLVCAWYGDYGGAGEDDDVSMG